MQTIIVRHGEDKLATKIFVSSEDGFNVASVIVMGKKECLLIDTQWTRANAHRVIAEIMETGLELKTIFVQSNFSMTSNSTTLPEILFS